MKLDFLVNSKKYFVSLIKKYFLHINLYKSNKFLTKINMKELKKRKLKLIIFKSKRDVIKKKIEMHGYFKKYKEKLKRFDKKYYFLVLADKRKLLCSVWIYHGSKFHISEIDIDLNLKKQFLINDGETPKRLRNKGYFSLLMKLAKNKFIRKNVIVFVQSNNSKSEKGIKKSGFNFVKKIYGF